MPFPEPDSLAGERENTLYSSYLPCRSLKKWQWPDLIHTRRPEKSTYSSVAPKAPANVERFKLLTDELPTSLTRGPEALPAHECPSLLS